MRKTRMRELQAIVRIRASFGGLMEIVLQAWRTQTPCGCEGSRPAWTPVSRMLCAGRCAMIRESRSSSRS